MKSQQELTFCPYHVLGFDENRLGVTDAMVKTAYRKLALKYHPDRNPTEDGREMFETIKLASEVLLNAELRRKFDDIEKARKERDANVAKSDQRRQGFVSDLLQREKEYQDALINLLNKHKQQTSKAKPQSEFEQIMQEIKAKEKLEEMKEKERQK